MIARLAKKIARKYMGSQQPLRLQPDYGERNAADFLGDRNVARNTGYGENIKPGPGNAFDEVVADNFSDFLGEDEHEILSDIEAGMTLLQTGRGAEEADEVESFEIVDDLDEDVIVDDLERMAEFWKESRLPSRKHHSDEVVDKAVEQWRDDNPEVAKKFDDEKVDSKEEMMEKLKQADDIIDDIGLGRLASDQIGKGRNGYVAMWNRERVEVFADTSLEAQELAQEHFQRNTRKRVKSYDVTVVLAEKGGKQVTHMPLFASDRSAKDHEQSGSYMSRQNLREMSDMADFIVDDIGNEGLDDWVEDKISQSYAALNDVARYRGYRDDHPHGEEEIVHSFRLAGGEIIDDMGVMADFDKYSRYSKGEKGSKEYEKAKNEGSVPEEFLEYEGTVTSPGESPDPILVEENREEMGKSAHYDIIDDLEW